jgi:CheY-like chemotaxis protein/nitrogen-specific signal transduction histidine kinase
MVGLMFAEVMALLGQSLSKIHERTVKLRRAKDDLQQLEQLKTDFFANVSHEFRTPITLTLGPLEGVMKGRYGELSEGVRSQVEIMIRNQQRLLGLINQILDVAKVEAGAVELRAALIPDLNKFVKERVEQFRSMAEQKGIQLKASFDPLVQGMGLYIDREKFDKILFNLLSNAFKFTKQGSIEVTTEIQGNNFFLKVSDTGVGIREDQLPHVFTRFRQAEGSASKEYAGTGLGLTLVKELAKLHGGDVSVTSRYGKGTTFQVTIPIGKGHLDLKSIVEFGDEEAPKTAPQAVDVQETTEERKGVDEMNAEAESQFDSSKPTVLYVDDNPDLRYYVRDLLVSRYNVFLAVDGSDGLAKAKKCTADLILSDVMMPVMTGTEFCRKIREDPNLKATPFVLLTARSMMDSKIEGLEKGADDYLTKPFSESELLARVKNLISLRKEQLKVKRELAAAQAIQMSLLPPEQQRFDGVILDLLYHPSEELSGDFCDIIPHGDWLYLYLADVTSHGTASAQVTYLLKEIFHQAVNTNGAREAPSLQDLVGMAGRQYAAHNLEYDVGIQVARFHCKRRLLEYIRGNAPPPIRVSRTGTPSVLSVRPGPAISVRTVKDLSFPFASLELEPGDVVYFFTDGCIEFPVENREFGLKRLSALLSSQRSEEWKKSAFEELVQANGGPIFPDDLTIVRLAVEPLTS